MTPTPGRWRLRIPELLLALASLAFSVLLAEGALRLFYVATDSGTLEDLYAETPAPGSEVTLGDMLTLAASPRLVYVFKPHLDVRFQGARVVTNELGFREATRPGPPGEKTLRIVGLGDSVMFGLGVEESERYLDVLEERLQHDVPTVSWETIALAIPGYNLVMEVEALKEFGLAYEPDLLVYGFVDNDSCLPNFVDSRRSIWSTDSFIWYYLTRDEEVRGLLRRKDASLANRGRSPAELRKQGNRFFEESYCNAENVMPAYRSLVGRENFDRALEELARIGRERGIPTVFLSHGRFPRVDRVPVPEDMVVVDLHQTHLEYLRDNGYRKLATSDLVLSPSDLHPSAKAHRLIGATLARRLVELGVVERMLDHRRTEHR